MHTYAYVLFSCYGQYTLTSSNKISMQAVCFSNIFLAYNAFKGAHKS